MRGPSASSALPATPRAPPPPVRETGSDRGGRAAWSWEDAWPLQRGRTPAFFGPWREAAKGTQAGAPWARTLWILAAVVCFPVPLLRLRACLCRLSVCAPRLPLGKPGPLQRSVHRPAVGPARRELRSAHATGGLRGAEGVAPGDGLWIYWSPGSTKPRPWSWGRAGPAPFPPGTGSDRPRPATWVTAGVGGRVRLPNTPLLRWHFPLTPSC